MGTIAQELTRIQTAKSDLKTAIERHGVEVPSATTIDGYATLVDQINLPATLEVKAATVHTSASTTDNYASNDNIRFLGSDGNKYTLAQWNAMFVDAGYDASQMTVEPVGLSVDAFDHSGESYMFDRYTGTTYNPSGETASTEGYLQHSTYNNAMVTSAASGTDYTTGKAWSVTVDGDELILSEANTGCSWRVSKNCGYVNSHKAFNIEERTYYLWAYTEWLRHRFAISSGITTTAADKTMGQVEIFNSSGVQAAANEDMYFFIRATSSDTWQNTNIKAKYNLNNRHATNSASLTQAITDAIYAKQVANGVNMNDTGVNSSSKSVLSEGSKGAEAIAVGGYWYIITPFISNPSSTTATVTNNCADSPAVYWAISKGFSLPSDTLLYAMYLNWAVVSSMRRYLVNVEGRSVSSIPTNYYCWSAVRYSAGNAWIVSLYNGNMLNANAYYRYFAVGAVESVQDIDGWEEAERIGALW